MKGTVVYCWVRRFEFRQGLINFVWSKATYSVIIGRWDSKLWPSLRDCNGQPNKATFWNVIKLSLLTHYFILTTLEVWRIESNENIRESMRTIFLSATKLITTRLQHQYIRYCLWTIQFRMYEESGAKPTWVWKVNFEENGLR